MQQLTHIGLDTTGGGRGVMQTGRVSSSVRLALCILLAASAVLAICGCDSDLAATESAEPAPSVVVSGTPFFTRGRDWRGTVPSVTLDEALAQVGVPVSLPDESLVGTATYVALDPTGAFDSGHPGLLFMYMSGVQLSINHREADLSRAASQTVGSGFTDGRTSFLELRDVDGMQALVSEAGTQVVQRGSRGENQVPAQVIWNADGLAYRLVAPVNDQSSERLIAIMRTMRPAR